MWIWGRVISPFDTNDAPNKFYVLSNFKSLLFELSTVATEFPVSRNQDVHFTILQIFGSFKFVLSTLSTLATEFRITLV